MDMEAGEGEGDGEEEGGGRGGGEVEGEGKEEWEGRKEEESREFSITDSDGVVMTESLVEATITEWKEEKVEAWVAATSEIAVENEMVVAVDVTPGATANIEVAATGADEFEVEAAVVEVEKEAGVINVWE